MLAGGNDSSFLVGLEDAERGTLLTFQLRSESIPVLAPDAPRLLVGC